MSVRLVPKTVIGSPYHHLEGTTFWQRHSILICLPRHASTAWWCANASHTTSPVQTSDWWQYRRCRKRTYCGVCHCKPNVRIGMPGGSSWCHLARATNRTWTSWQQRDSSCDWIYLTCICFTIFKKNNQSGDLLTIRIFQPIDCNIKI